jgi:hypothetical protein
VIWRRAAAFAAGLAMTASIGLTSVGATSAASPTLKIKAGSQWTAEVRGAGCEIETFAANGTFSGDMQGDAGTWSGGGKRIILTWTGGRADGLTFNGKFTTTPSNEYKGSYGGLAIESGELVKGAVPMFHGVAC